MSNDSQYLNPPAIASAASQPHLTPYPVTPAGGLDDYPTSYPPQFPPAVTPAAALDELATSVTATPPPKVKGKVNGNGNGKVKAKEEVEEDKKRKPRLNEVVEQTLRTSYHIARDSGRNLFFLKGSRYEPDPKNNWLIDRVQDVSRSAGKWSEYTEQPRKVLADVEHMLGGNVMELWPDGPPKELLNCRNGIVNIDTGELKGHSAGWLSTVVLPAEYGRDDADPGPWDEFIEGLFEADSVELAWEILGRCLAPCPDIAEAIILNGTGANGKSTFLKAVQLLTGRENVSHIPTSKLDSDKYASSGLYGKLVNIDEDAKGGKWSDDGTFKKIVTGEIIIGEEKYKASFPFKPYAALLLAGNNLPRPTDPCWGIFRRLCIVPFMKQFDPNDPMTRSGSEIIQGLATKQALSGALNKAIAGLRRLRARKQFLKSGTVIEAMREFQTLEDPMWAFVDGYVKQMFQTKGVQGGKVDGGDLLALEIFVGKEELKEAYNLWAMENNYPLTTARGLSLWVKRMWGGAFQESRPLVDGQRVRGWEIRLETISKLRSSGQEN